MENPTPPTDTHRRWYGTAEFGDPAPPDGTPGIELVGGALDGLWMVLVDDADPPYPGGLALIASDSHYGMQGGRALYDHADPPDGRLHWSGDMA